MIVIFDLQSKHSLTCNYNNGLCETSVISARELGTNYVHMSIIKLNNNAGTDPDKIALCRYGSVQLYSGELARIYTRIRMSV